MLKVVVTGSNGQLGSEIRDIKNQLKDSEFFFTDVAELDITSHVAVSDFVKANQINVIINCAAYTAVDKAESDINLARKVNAIGPATLAKVAKESDAVLIHISTDYVFDGTACTPYTEDTPTSPLGAYGQTKLEGEQAVAASGAKSAIIRTSWLYSGYGNNFVKTMMRLGGEKESLGVIFDQVGTPTYARDLAEAILAMVSKIGTEPMYAEVFHFSNEGVCSWYDFATKIMQLSARECKVNPIETKEYPTPAKRPSYSVLNKTKIKRTLGIEIPHWEEALKKCIIRL